jgi:hypothetical protein
VVYHPRPLISAGREHQTRSGVLGFALATGIAIAYQKALAISKNFPGDSCHLPRNWEASMSIENSSGKDRLTFPPLQLILSAA